jgi:hypothetical protein
MFTCLRVATDVTNISQTLRVDSVDLQDGRGVAVNISFKVHAYTHSFILVAVCLATKLYGEIPGHWMCVGVCRDEGVWLFG